MSLTNNSIKSQVVPGLSAGLVIGVVDVIDHALEWTENKTLHAAGEQMEQALTLRYTAFCEEPGENGK